MLVLRGEADTASIETPGTSAALPEMYYLVIKGKTGAEIVAILGLSPRTVSKHLEHAIGKLGVESRPTAASVAMARIRMNGKDE